MSRVEIVRLVINWAPVRWNQVNNCLEGAYIMLEDNDNSAGDTAAVAGAPRPLMSAPGATLSLNDHEHFRTLFC